MANDIQDSEEYNLHIQNMEMYASGAEDKNISLFQFLDENVGLETDLANELISNWAPPENHTSPAILAPHTTQTENGTLPLENKKETYISLISGLIAFVAICTAFILQFLYPVPAGRHSAAFSPAGPIIFLLSMASFILGPTALFFGISSIRKAPEEELPFKNKALSITGIIFGGAVSLVYLAPLLFLVFLLLKG